MAMFRTGNHRNDVERGPEGSSEAGQRGSAQLQDDEHPESGMSRNGPSEQRQDFDEDANDLWSLYGKEAKSQDKARIETLKDDMDGVLIFAGLFSAILTAFLVPKIQDLMVNSADQSAYYQNQTVQILDRISQQLASTGDQISTNSNPPLPPYPTFHPSASNRRVNIIWLISLVCSLSAALLATLVQQWVRAYMRVFQQSSNPLKTARIRQVLFEGAKRLPTVAEFVPGLIHISLILFFWGFGDLIFQIDTAVFITTMVPILICVCLYIYCVFESIRNPQWPYRTPFSGFIWFLIQKLPRRSQYSRSPDKGAKPTSMEVRQEDHAMENNPSRKDRDVRAFQWLVDNINGSNETHAFVLAMPGSFKQEWGRKVWKGVVEDDRSTSYSNLQAQPHPGLPLASAREGSTVYELCRCVRNFFYAYDNEGDFMDTEERQRRMRGCVETAASLVCCTGVELGLFGKVEKILSKVLSKLGDKERTNNPLTIISNPLFTVRWTCLSLVAIWKMVYTNKLREQAKFALDGFARLHIEYGTPDTMALMDIAQRIDRYLMKAWASVVDLHLAFVSEPSSISRTKPDIIRILKSREESISDLERIANEAVGVEDVDWRISLFQERMDGITHQLMQRLPGVFFNKLKSAAPIMISEAFDFPSGGTTPVPPPLIFPGQQIQSLCTLGRRLRDIIEGLNTESHEETLKSLESLREIPVPLRAPNYLMKRQLWRLLDLRDGRGLGFTIELFFLAVRQLSSTPSSSELELTKVFYTGTFEVITSNWKKSKNSVGTQRVLLDLLCDLVIGSRGVFSDFSYPPYIVKMLLDLVEKVVEGHGNLNPLINEVIEELEDDDLRHRMDNNLRDQALDAIGPPPDTTPP
ncbi:hypothetical protein F5888DRAFT_1731188 [Russula emetica]|nr:hypothetical protein F5888DRAFT_1731188 [Russula emetica]